MSELEKNAYTLAPFVAEALREVANEATFPDTDERKWTERQKASRDFAVQLAKEMIRGDLDEVLTGPLRDHAEAARDAAMEERDG